jgi:hypothetical protein
MNVDLGDVARWASTLGAVSVGAIIILFGSSQQRSRAAPRPTIPKTNLEAQTPAGLRSAAASAIDAIKINPWLAPTLFVILFAFTTLAQPAHLLPAMGDVEKASAPPYTLTLSVETNRHLEEGDSFELRLDVDGAKSAKDACLVAKPSNLSAAAIAPGADVAPVNQFTFDPRQCTGFASWLVGIKKGGDLVVAATVARKTKTNLSIVGSVNVNVASEKPGVSSDVLFSALITSFVALIAFLRNDKS